MEHIKKFPSISFDKLIWLIPIIYFLHEIEEWNIYLWWAIQFPDAPPLPVSGGRIWLIGSSIFIFILIAIFQRFKNIKITTICSLSLAVLPFANGLQHIFWTFSFSSWAPGVLFGGFIGVPFGIYMAWRAVSENLVNVRFILLLILFSVFILVETILAGHQVPASMNLITSFVTWLVRIFEGT